MISWLKYRSLHSLAPVFNIQCDHGPDCEECVLAKSNKVTQSLETLSAGRKIRNIGVSVVSEDLMPTIEGIFLREYECNVSKVLCVDKDEQALIDQASLKVFEEVVSHVFYFTTDSSCLKLDKWLPRAKNKGSAWIILETAEVFTGLPYRHKCTEDKFMVKKVGDHIDTELHVYLLTTPNLKQLLSWFALHRFRVSLYKILRTDNLNVRLFSNVHHINLRHNYYGFG